jgi:hypothetical protein
VECWCHSACHGPLGEVKRCAPCCSLTNLAKGRVKEAGPEALVQLRNLTVVERTSEQLWPSASVWGGVEPAGAYTSSNLAPAMLTSVQSGTAERLDIKPASER